MTEWKIERTPYESEIDIVSDGRTIATVEAGEGQERVAALIAAAPEMYIALQNVRVELDSYPHCPFCGSVHGEGHEKDCIGYEVEAAIMKARGEE